MKNNMTDKEFSMITPEIVKLKNIAVENSTIEKELYIQKKN